MQVRKCGTCSSSSTYSSTSWPSSVSRLGPNETIDTRLKQEGGAWRLSASARQLLAELLRYRDALLPLVTAAGAPRRRGVRYVAGRCGAALTLLASEPQLSSGTLALVLEDLRLSAALVGLPRLLGERQ